MTKGNLAFPNITGSTSVTFTHHSTRRHHIASTTPPGASPAFAYESDGAGGDGNGGLTSRPATVAGDLGKTITYDVEGRVATVTAGADVVQSVYDDRGERVARIINGTDLTFFFGRYVEVRGGQMTRHIYAGARRIAFSPIPAPPALTLAALPDDHPAILLARLQTDAAWLDGIQGPGPDLRPAAAMSGLGVLVAATLILATLPGYSRVGIVRRMRRGRVGILTLVYVVVLPQWPPPSLPTLWGAAALACPPGAPSQPSYIVHTDHLGSTTLLTAYELPGEADGSVIEYYRYGPYGKMQVYNRNGSAVSSGSEKTEFTYTSQRWDATVELYYYRARFYDPIIARFTSSDPIREYHNPYSYVSWRPTHLADPTGMSGVGSMAIAAGLPTCGPGYGLAEWYAILGDPAKFDGIPGFSLGGIADRAAGALAGDAYSQGLGINMTPASPFGQMSLTEAPSPTAPGILGYFDFNVTANLYPASIGGLGLTLGIQFTFDGASLETSLVYLGPSFQVGGLGAGATLTFAESQQVNEGVAGAVSFVSNTTATPFAAQFGYALGTNTGAFVEIGGAYSSPGVSLAITLGVGPQTLSVMAGDFVSAGGTLAGMIAAGSFLRP